MQLKAVRSRSFAFVGSEEKLIFQTKSTFMQRKQPICVCVLDVYFERIKNLYCILNDSLNFANTCNFVLRHLNEVLKRKKNDLMKAKIPNKGFTWNAI